LPLPIITFNNLEDNRLVLSYREILTNKSGVYCLTNRVNGKLYIGSAKDLPLYKTYCTSFFLRSKKKSNIALQYATLKHGLNKFSFGILEYFIYDSKLVIKL
jgi:group I intron endonuclease